MATQQVSRLTRCCDHCGLGFVTFPSRLNGLRFCSRACVITFRHARSLEVRHKTTPEDLHTCSSCAETKEASAFASDNRRPRGKQSQCRNCQAAAGVEYRKRNRQAIGESERRWREANPDRVRATYTTYNRANREHIAEKIGAWRSEHPGARAAHRIVDNALKTGLLARPDACQECGRSRRVYGHHHLGYEHPLKVQWLCMSCHRLAHQRASTSEVPS